MHRRTQNSGVMVKGEHEGKVIEFYGIIIDIIELEYLLGHNRLLLFKCDWWNLKEKTGLQKDKNNITSVNISRTWYEEQPFVLASQARQVFYVEDLKLGNNWRVVEIVQPRGSFDVPELEEEDNDHNNLKEPYQQDDVCGVVDTMEVDNQEAFLGESNVHDEVILLERDDITPLERFNVNIVSCEESLKGIDEENDNFINDDEESSSYRDDSDENSDTFIDDDSDNE